MTNKSVTSTACVTPGPYTHGRTLRRYLAQKHRPGHSHAAESRSPGGTNVALFSDALKLPRSLAEQVPHLVRPLAPTGKNGLSSGSRRPRWQVISIQARHFQPPIEKLGEGGMEVVLMLVRSSAVIKLSGLRDWRRKLAASMIGTPTISAIGMSLISPSSSPPLNPSLRAELRIHCWSRIAFLVYRTWFCPR